MTHIRGFLKCPILEVVIIKVRSKIFFKLKLGVGSVGGGGVVYSYGEEDL